MLFFADFWGGQSGCVGNLKNNSKSALEITKMEGKIGEEWIKIRSSQR
jgi:hypothetical protein